MSERRRDAISGGKAWVVIVCSYLSMVAPGANSAESNGGITAVAVGDVYDMNDGKSNTNPNGDTWVTSWGANDDAWVSINDGAGWDAGEKFSQRGFGKLTGNPNDNTCTFWGVSLNPGKLRDTRNRFNAGGKGYHMGIYEQNGVLYDCINNYDSKPPYSAFISSDDGGINWTNHLGQKNTPADLNSPDTSMFKFDNPNFVRYGKGSDVPNKDQAGKYLYLIVQGIYLGRVERTKFPALKKTDYQWYKKNGLDGNLESSWSAAQDDAAALAGLPKGDDMAVGYTAGCPIYNYGFQKYLATGYSAYWPPGEKRSFWDWASGLPRYHIYSSDHPWGPWVEAGSFPLWGSTVAEYLMCNKYTSNDGKKMWICTAGSQPAWVGWNTHAPWRYGFQYMPLYFSTGEVARYEAEDAVLSGAANIQNTYPSFSGRGYVTGILGASDKLHFNIIRNVKEDGWYIVKIGYTNPLNNANTMSVYVNDKKVKVVKLAQNDSDNNVNHHWTNRSDIYYLSKGIGNAIEIRCDKGDNGNGVKIDYLDVSTETTFDEGRNVAPNATATASSGDARFAISGCPGDVNGEWSAAGTIGEWIKLDWGAQAQTIFKIRLYNKSGMKDQMTAGALSFSDGTSVNVGKLQNDGEAGAVVTFAPKTVTWVKLSILEVRNGTSHAGLGQFEVYSK